VGGRAAGFEEAVWPAAYEQTNSHPSERRSVVHRPAVVTHIWEMAPAALSSEEPGPSF